MSRIGQLASRRYSGGEQESLDARHALSTSSFVEILTGQNLRFHHYHSCPCYGDPAAAVTCMAWRQCAYQHPSSESGEDTDLCLRRCLWNVLICERESEYDREAERPFQEICSPDLSSEGVEIALRPSCRREAYLVVKCSGWQLRIRHRWPRSLPAMSRRRRSAVAVLGAPVALALIRLLDRGAAVAVCSSLTIKDEAEVLEVIRFMCQ